MGDPKANTGGQDTFGTLTVMPETARSPRPRGPVVIEVRDLVKSFILPAERVDTLKERVVRRRRSVGPAHELQALRGVSFDVHEGEFFGIVGRNGSGKSTLLKLLASIYRADSGTMRIAGRLAPFIELGVGFNVDLTARENVTLNGVLNGLGRREAAQNLDAILDFADLREFVDLKLKNYSSGMLVRLAFAAMVQADADVMLVDEVLAVGDAQFGEKCMDVFRAKRDAGKTLILVTHDMATVQAFCDRAMLLHHGDQRYLGDPEETAARYYRLNFSGGSGYDAPSEGGTVLDVNVRVIHARLVDETGARIDTVEQGTPLRVDVVLEARHVLDDPVVGLHVRTAEGAWVTGHNLLLNDVAPDMSHRVEAGQRVRVAGTIGNPLVPGRYRLDAWISREREHGDLALHVLHLTDFFVYGTRPGAGSVRVDSEVRAVVDRA
jgi:ABC-2 type transport system ATP-binding protein